MNKSILICDDDEGILEMLETLLEDYGYRIIPVRNSLDIYTMIEKENPDLLLLDLWMPVLSGDQILRALRMAPETHNLPVIVISASTDGKLIASKAGATDYMAKPFDLDDLVQTIDHLVQP